jgi:hypothetical protein
MGAWHCRYAGGGYPVRSPGTRDALVVAVPYLKADLAHHPAFSKNLQLLREWGIHVLYDPEHYPSPQVVPWEMILETLPHS